MVRREYDVIELKEMYDIAQLKREEMKKKALGAGLNLHRRLINLGYQEQNPIVCEYGRGYVSPQTKLSKLEGLTLPVMLPAELVPGSEAIKLLENRENSSKIEVYAVYSQP